MITEREKWVKVRNWGIAGIILSLLSAGVFFKITTDAQKEIMRLDQGMLDQTMLE